MTSSSARAERDRRIRDEVVRPLVTPQLVERHRQRPFGPWDPELAVVARYLGSRAELVRYALLEDPTGSSWNLVELPRRRGEPIQVGEQSFPSYEVAAHAVFRLRLELAGLLSRSPTEDG